jgi:hypothetical protein
VNLNKLSDKIVFNSLKFIKHGNLKIINHGWKRIYPSEMEMKN